MCFNKMYIKQLEQWESKGLKQERVAISSDFKDPVTYRIQVSIDNKSGPKRNAGYGEGLNASSAYKKAIGELVERLAIPDAKVALGRSTSNGIAAHRFSILAKQGAAFELIERDAFFRHWLTKTPFKKYLGKTTDLTNQLVLSVVDSGYEMLLRETFLGTKISYIVMIINKKTKGFVLGSSIQQSAKASIEKAAKEAFFSLSAFSREKIEIDWKVPELKFHRNYWLCHKPMPEWLFNFDCGIKVTRPRIKAKMKYKQLKGAPIYVMAAYSEQLIDLWVGDPPEKVKAQIETNYGCEVNTDPHPFP